MGTNYYHQTNICACCGRCDLEHIGKSSMGWQFTFHATESARSWSDWKLVLKEGQIVNEYDEPQPYDEFVAFVEQKQANNTRNHALLYPDRGNYIDDEGYSFSPGGFS